MGFSYGNTLSAVVDESALACFRRIGASVKRLEGTVSTFSRNNVFLPSGVTPGTYTLSTITVDAQGRVTSAASGSAPSAVTGSGTDQTIAMWNDGTTVLGDSPMTWDGTSVSVAGRLAVTNSISASNLSGTNTGDNAVNSLYSGLVSNATHTGEVTGATALTIDKSIAATWGGIWTYSAQDVHNAGIDLGTSGRLNSNVADTGTNIGVLIKPTTAFTTGRFIAQIQDSAGVASFAAYPGGLIEIGGNVGGSTDAMLTVGATTSKNAGIFFSPASFSGSGQTFFGVAATVAGGYFKAQTSATVAMTNLVGGAFEAYVPASASANLTDTWGLWVRGQANATSNSNSTRTWTNTGAIRIYPVQTVKNGGTYTNIYGMYVPNVASNAATTGLVMTNTYGFYIEEQTRGGTINNGIFFANATAAYKAIAIREQNAWIGSAAAGELTIGGTNFRCTATNQAVFGAAAIAQPTTAIAASTFVANASLIFNDSATWDGYTMGQVVKALRNYGLLA